MAALTAWMLIGYTAYSQPFTNGGFEQPPILPGIPNPYPGPIPGWDVSKSEGRLWVGPAYNGVPNPAEGSQHFEIGMNDSSRNNFISQTFSTTPGSQYRVSFQVGWGGNDRQPKKSVRASVTSDKGEPLASLDANASATRSYGSLQRFAFTATTDAATLTFLETSQDHYQASLFLDNVHVESLLETKLCKTEVGGNIANQTWTKDKSPYCVTNDVYVAGNLTIREGVEVRMQGNYAFEAAGRLRALGTADEPITFHPADLAVGWQGLVFRDAVPGSFFVHTIIEGSKNSGVRITNTPPAFTNCVIRNNTSPGNGGGILATVSGSPLTLQGCLITNNVAGPHGAGTVLGGGMYVKGTGILNHCDVLGNKTRGATGIGGGVYVDGDATVEGSSIVNNLAGGSSGQYGSGLQIDSGRLRMANCWVAANGVKGAAGDSGGLRIVGSDADLVNCIVSGNASYGIGQYRGSLRILNCTIVNNQSTGVSWFSGTIAITNSIVYFNNDGGGQVDGGRTVRYSNIQGGYPGEGNISFAPALCPDNYSLIQGSPCVDAGHPGLEFRDSLISTDDCSLYARGGPRNDMGAYGGPGACYWTEPRAEPVIRIAPDNTIGFVGQPVSLGVIATGQEPLAYQWFKNGSSVAGQTNAVMTFRSAALADAADYYVKVSNALGEINSPAVPDWPPVHLGVARYEARQVGLTQQGRPRLLIRNGQGGQKCAVYSAPVIPAGEVWPVPGIAPTAWELRDILTFSGTELDWTDPRPLDAGEDRYYGVVPVP